MKYTIDLGVNYPRISIEEDTPGAVLGVGDTYTVMTHDEFKEFRRAIGYVWTAVSE